MTRESFVYLWKALVNRRHWKSFTLELVNGSRIEVNHPESVSLGKELFAVRSTSGVMNYIDYVGVVRFIEETGVG